MTRLLHLDLRRPGRCRDHRSLLEEEKSMRTTHEPIHPEEILLKEFLNPMGTTRYRLAQTISVPAIR